MNQEQVKEYWETRLGNDYSLGGVGHLAVGKYYNYWLYKMREKHFKKAVKKISLNHSFPCFEVGSGTGFYLGQLLRLGFTDITGSDMTVIAVKNLQNKYPGHKIINIDITAHDSRFNDTFSLVTCMDVLFHIIDNAAYLRAFRNLHNLTNDRMYLIITENLTPANKQREHIYDRPKAAIINMITKSGFQIIHQWSPFIFLNPPVQSSNKFLWKISDLRIQLLKKINSSRFKFMGSVIGCFYYLLDSLLLTAGFKGKGTSILICEKKRCTQKM
jgi:hypothetical protein